MIYSHREYKEGTREKQMAFFNGRGQQKACPESRTGLKSEIWKELFSPQNLNKVWKPHPRPQACKDKHRLKPFDHGPLFRSIPLRDVQRQGDDPTEYVLHGQGYRISRALHDLV